MARAAQRKRLPLSVEAFRAWAVSRPDEERWELIDGVPMMMAPPTRDHQRIASNLERLLNDALKRQPQPRGMRLAAYQRIGLNLQPLVQDYDPEPDVAVVEVGRGVDPRYADRFYLAAEVVSQSDLPVIEAKREIYRRHPHCECVLVIRQDRCEVSVDLRSQDDWQRQQLDGADDELMLAGFGLRCMLRDIYDGTVGVSGNFARP